MAEEKKLGPKATYLNSDGSAQSVSVNGVNFKEGEAVDLVKELGGESQAKAMLEKLSKNPYFKVDGGPQHDQAKYADAKKQADAAKKEHPHGEPPGQAKKPQPKNDEPPEEYKTPESATLDRPDLPRGRK